MRIRTIKPEFWRSDDIASLSWDARLVFIGLWSYVDDNGVGRDSLPSIVGDLFAADMTADLYGESTETLRRVSLALGDLAERGLIVRYEVEGKAYLQVTGWTKHQVIKTPSKGHLYPVFSRETSSPPRSLPGVSPESPRSLPGVSPESTETPGTGTGEQGNRGTGEQGNRGAGEQGSREGVQGEVAQHELEPEPAPTASRKRAAQKTATGSKTASGSRIPDGWQPSPDLAAWTRTHAPAAANDREVDRFRDYWTAQPGARGRKSDWDATWRNWARKTQDDAQARGAPGTPPLDITQPTTDAEAAALVASIYTPTALKRILAEEEEPR